MYRPAEPEVHNEKVEKNSFCQTKLKEKPMKTRIAIALFVVLFAFTAFAQSNLSVSVLTGYTMTAFEDQESAAGTLPIGVQVGYKVNPSLVVGGEFNMPLGGFSFEDEFYGMKVSSTINQNLIGAFAKYTLGSGNLQPFVKVGAGQYFGNRSAEVEYMGEKESEDFDIESAFGFSIGAGASLTPSIFAEFNYHLVNREDAGMNTWSVLVGYKIIK